jgi:hypothetical protein
VPELQPEARPVFELPESLATLGRTAAAADIYREYIEQHLGSRTLSADLEEALARWLLLSVRQTGLRHSLLGALAWALQLRALQPATTPAGRRLADVLAALIAEHGVECHCHCCGVESSEGWLSSLAARFAALFPEHPSARALHHWLANPEFFKVMNASELSPLADELDGTLNAFTKRHDEAGEPLPDWFEDSALLEVELRAGLAERR